MGFPSRRPSRSTESPQDSCRGTQEPKTEGAFLAASRDNPDDDMARLIFADWLGENGQPARAELIRIQIECTRLDEAERAWTQFEQRARAILEEHEATWTASLRPPVCSK